MILKKRLLLSLIVFLVLLSLVTGCRSIDYPKDDGSKDENSEELYNEKTYPPLIVDDYNTIDMEKINQYDIKVTFDSEEKSYSGVQKVIYTNNETVTLDAIYFHLYPNAFKNEETAPFLFDNFQEAYPTGFSPGYMDIESLSINGEVIQEYSIEETILKIPLGKSLKPGNKIEIDMTYQAVLPPAYDRFGYGDKTFNFGNWYPIAAVYDDEGWNLDPYYSIGDPFYSDTSNYKVTITTPKDMVIASSGHIKSNRVQGNLRIWNIEAKLMRDFAWVGSMFFKQSYVSIDGTLVKLYYLNDDQEIKEFVTKVAYDSIKTFNKLFGQYPYGEFSIVATSFQTGMEYPGLVFIGEQYYSDYYKGYLELVIAHETAHQWWYGVVGNDEVDESWLDESLTTYSEVIYADEVYDEDVGESYYQTSVEEGYNQSIKLTQSNEVVLKSLKDFENWEDYGALAYNKGAMFIHEIEERYGEEMLYDILRSYYDQYRFLNATTEDFIGVCQEITGDNFQPLVDQWLYNR